MGQLKVIVTEAAGAVIAKLCGPLDIPSCANLERVLLGISARKPKLVILDLSEVTFVASLGMGVLVAFRAGLLRAHGAVLFAAAPPTVFECFSRARLNTIFEFRDSVELCLPKAG